MQKAKINKSIVPANNVQRGRRCIFLVIMLCLAALTADAQDSTYIRVHFLYGSRPLKAFRETEPRWFGGILGGHAGIESVDNQVLNFIPHGRFHVVANKRKHGKYVVDSVRHFYSRLGGQHPDSAKKAIIVIPVTTQQKLRFDSIAAKYLDDAPYDYAFIGMRCGAATYEILAQLGIVERLSLLETVIAVPYPKKLRRQLLIEAAARGWTVVREEGTTRRRWEGD
ncbi:MAG: hypothetical protein K0Q66_2334 [Chitinophagaceae bacterium]|jgi:hypothetical protein|nr:hypothetical protein [Chitinophagaceae bacterium]